MAIKFYYSPMSSATRVHWTLEELAVPYEKIRIDLSKGDQRKPEYLAINPNGKVPALIDGDAKLFESLAIILHLGDRYGVDKGLWPKPGTTERAEAFSWTVWGTIQVLDCAIDHMLHTNDELSFALPKAKRSKDVAEQSKALWHQHLSTLDERLQGRQYINGDGFSLVDLANASVIGTGQAMAKLQVDAHERVAAWVARCQSRPAFIKTGSEK